MDTERARNPDTETERGRQTQRGGRGSEWQPQRIETRQPSRGVMGGEGGGGPRDALPPQLPLKPWACAALGSSRPHPPSPLPHPHLTRLWPQRHLPRWGAGVPLASFPSAGSSPSVATDGGAAGQDSAGLPASPPCPLLWAPPCPLCTSGDGRLVVAPSTGRSNSIEPRIVLRCRAITRCCSRLQWFSRDRMTG